MKKSSILKKDYNRAKFSLSDPAIWQRLEKLRGKDFVIYRRLLAKAEKGEILTDFPIEVQIKTSFNCNHKCTKCLHGMGFFPTGPQYFMKFATYKKVLDEGKKKGLKSLVLTGGETFLHPQIIDFINYAGKLQFPDLAIISNGALMTDKIIDALIENQVARINISLDAITRETYKKIRGVDDFDKVTRNIKALLKQKAKKKSQLPLLSVSFVLSEENAPELDKFVKYWRKYTDGGIKIYPFKNVFSVIDKEFQQEYGISKTKLKLLDKSYLPVALSKKIPILSHYDNSQCMTPWYRCEVGYKGQIEACTTQGFCDHPKMRMGNINRSSFERIWKSKKWSHLRELTKKKQFDQHPVCFKCQRAV